MNVLNLTTSSQNILADYVSLVRAEIKKHSLSQAKVARDFGISQAALSQWLKGTYRGSNEAIDEMAERWLRTRFEGQKHTGAIPKLKGYVATATTRRVFAALEYAQATDSLAVVYGAAGVGKTEAVMEYARKHSSVWYVNVTPATAPMGGFMLKVAKAVGAKIESRTSSVLEVEICATLKGVDGLLIVDETQHLRHQALEQVRAIHDQTDIGVVLVGNELVWSRVHGTRSAAFAQLHSRVAQRTHLKASTKRDAVALLDALARQNGLKMDDSARKFLVSVAVQPGGVRSMLHVARLSAMLGGGKAISELNTNRAFVELKVSG